MDTSTGSVQADIQEGDDPAEAFDRLRAVIEGQDRELALLRRAVEGLAAERAELPEVVDYSETLGRMSHNIAAIAQRADALAKGSAQAMTPNHIANRIVAASSDARRNDQQIIADARSALDQATRQIAAMVVSARRGDEQNRLLAGAAIGGAIAGMTLWAALAGPIARAMPEGWHWPERIAARTLRLPMWEAGQRLMGIAGPEAWNGVVVAGRIVTANHDTIQQCSRAAAKTGRAVRCTVRIGAEGQR